MKQKQKLFESLKLAIFHGFRFWKNQFAFRLRAGSSVVEVERAYFSRTCAKLELLGFSQNKPEPIKNTIQPALIPSFSFIKTGNFQLEPTSSILKNQARRAFNPRAYLLWA